MIVLLPATVLGMVSDLGLQQEYSLDFPLSLLFTDIAFFALLRSFPSDFDRIGIGLLFFQLLLVVTYIDINELKIQGWPFILILLCGIHPMGIPGIADAIIGLVIISVPLLIFSILTHEAIGHADVELIAVCGFVLGSTRIFFAATVGMVISSIVQTFRIMIHKTHRKARCALAPYFAVGCFFAYLIPF